MGFSIPLASILINNAGDSSMVEKVIWISRYFI
jgi:hypothetical protein